MKVRTINHRWEYDIAMYEINIYQQILNSIPSFTHTLKDNLNNGLSDIEYNSIVINVKQYQEQMINYLTNKCKKFQQKHPEEFIK